MIGKLLSGHQILEKIRDGSVGRVWLATNPRGQRVAVKQISRKNSAIGRKRRLFKREALRTKTLRHPGIIRVDEYIEFPSQPFFTMEYFDSESLRYSMFSCPERVRAREFAILHQIAAALAFVHANGLIHRDVKPENILVSAASDIRLIDFSLAQTRWDRRLQFFRKVEGTPLYMAPEQVQGRRCDERTDIYAFGCLMFELLTKQTPFQADSNRKLLQKHLNEPVPSMRRLIPTISSDLDELVRKLLAKRRKDRFQDMTTILYELDKWTRKSTGLRLQQVRIPETK